MSPERVFLSSGTLHEEKDDEEAQTESANSTRQSKKQKV